MKQEIVKVKQIVGCSIKRMNVELEGRDYIYTIYYDQIHFGGKNCEISEIQNGSKLLCDEVNSKVRTLYNVTILSCDCREVDLEGNLIKW